MKIVQSFWSGNQKEISNTYGWFSYKYNWISWILSCQQLIKYHKNVELYTDEFGYKILIEELKLPYTKVHVVLDELNHYNKALWAIAKIRTFQLQTEPFIHIDGDVYLWESLEKKFKDSNLITQNLEITTEYYRVHWNVIYPELNFLPQEMQDYNESKSNYACNMGIVGGNNLAFFEEYTKKSFEFVNNNLISHQNDSFLNFNIFFEQVLFYELSKISDEKIDFLFSKVSLDNDYIGFADFDKVPKKKYLHLLGDYKRNPWLCNVLEIYVMKYYPEKYSLLMNLVNKKINNNNNNNTYDLNKFKVSSLLNEFENDLRSFNFKSENFLLKRDLFNEGLPNKFDEFIIKKINFYLVKLIGFDVKKVENEKNVIRIEEQSNIPTILDFDDIDEIILGGLLEPVQYLNFIKKMQTYLDEEDSDGEFISLINQRLRNYLIFKIISIYN